MHIKVIAVNKETKTSSKGTSYQVAEVTFKNLTYQGKTETKKLMSFGPQKDAFDMMINAAPGEEYTVVVHKNDKGYNDWTSVTPGGSSESAAARSAPAAPARGNPAPRSTHETPEERAKKQIYIVRQSSINYAIDLLTTGAKTPPAVEDVMKVAKQFEDYVFGDTTESEKQDGAAALASMEDDIPY